MRRADDEAICPEYMGQNGDTEAVRARCRGVRTRDRRQPAEMAGCPQCDHGRTQFGGGARRPALRMNALGRVWAAAATLAEPGVFALCSREGFGAARNCPAAWRNGAASRAAPRPDGRIVWLHAASVGETVSILPVLQKLAELRPDLAVLVTTGTVTSARLLERRLEELGRQPAHPASVRSAGCAALGKPLSRSLASGGGGLRRERAMAKFA